MKSEGVDEMTKVNISGLSVLDEQFDYLDIQKALDEEIELTREEADYVNRVVKRNYYIEQVAEAMGLTFEEFRKSNHPNLEDLKRYAKGLKVIFDIPSNIIVDEVDAAKIYRRISEGGKARAFELSGKKKRMAKSIRDVYKLDYNINLNTLDDIIDYFRDQVNKDEELKKAYGL